MSGQCDPKAADMRSTLRMEHIQARTHHARRGALKNAFSYGVDYVLCDPDGLQAPFVMSRNRFNLWSVWDRSHGGRRGEGRGLGWFRDMLAARGFDPAGAKLLLLTQPNFLWFNFNPVSFWIALSDGRPCAFVAEVNNTFGGRHCYFCAHPDFRPIAGSDTLMAEKLLHVSPFQKVAGQYTFNMDVTERAISIRILYENGDQGVLATLAGRRRPATSRSLLWAAFRRPFGAARVVALIHWQALVLYFKRAPFMRNPAPPARLVSDSVSTRRKSA